MRTHGINATYVAGCRCAPCRDAHTDYNSRYRASRRALARPVAHGSIGAYTNDGCRCSVCTETWRAHWKERRDAWTPAQRRASNRAARTRVKTRVKMRSILPAPPEVHGTYNGYNNYRCRCEPCRQAASVYLRARYRRRIRRDKVKTKLGISWSRVL